MPEARHQDEPQGPSFLRSALQSIGMFLVIQFVIKTIMNGGFMKPANDPASSAAKAPIPSFSERPSVNEFQGQYNPIPQSIAPIWPSNTSVDVSAYVSSSWVMPSFKSINPESLVLQQKELRLDNWGDAREIHTSFEVPKAVQNNGSLWAHIYVAQSGAPMDPTSNQYDTALAYHFVRPLNQYLVTKKTAKTRNLLSNSVDDISPEGKTDTSSASGPTIASYYHPNFTLSFVPNAGIQAYPSMHPAAREWVQLEATGARDATGQNGWYYPILYLNTFWQLRDHMTEINGTVKRLPLNIHLNTLSHWKFSTISSFDFGMKANQAKLASGEKLAGGGDGSEMEEIKRILIDSNIYLLSTTAVVGVLHTLFEMLAFKSDVSHWRNKKDNVGVSMRTILANVFMQAIIFLYLLDNQEGTSWMILFGQGLGIVLEAWKITKTVDVRMRQTPADSKEFPWRYLPYTIVFEDKHKLSETEKKTQEYDQIAFSYMYWAAIPLLLAYAGYSLIYETHKGWYSFIIATLVGAIYAYGFLMMVPALYINYRLQSVAHMPGRTMMYKFLNTFIDDLFAFTVKMPTLHRLATLRDDVIFFVYLYQAWKYKVDYSRVNEFGQGGDDAEDENATSSEDASTKKSLEADSGNKSTKELKAAPGIASGRSVDGDSRKRK